jgi:chemotaxis protein methyltransferase CheR
MTLTARHDFGEADYQLFQKKVQARMGLRLSDYKADQMRRRLGSLSQQAGFGSFSAFYAAMERDNALMATFLDRVTINVTEFLRNPERFDELAHCILPALLSRRGGAALNVWSAGCSYGAEAYTVALLLHETSPGIRHQIKGTDIDPAMLARANAPCFSDADMVNISPARRQAHFDVLATGGFRPGPHLAAQTQFRRHDLLADPYPRGQYDLILCRNVLIYFTDEARERVYRGFWDALRPGGVLFVGGTERLSDHRALGFDLVRSFFYRRPA